MWLIVFLLINFGDFFTKTLSTFKHFSCFVAFLFIAIISVIATCSLNADTITSFPESDFWTVDHTTQEYTVIGSTQYNPTGIIGYKYKTQNINLQNIENAYQLTDTVLNTTVAIWNRNKIDLNQSWQFDLKLFFDTGSYRVNPGTPIGDTYRRVSEGICFVLHNIDTQQTLIGRTTADIGYAGIYPSFAVEFDTEHNSAGFEGGIENGSKHHIAYLRGDMRALPGTYQPMQNNWANVGIGQWFNVRFVWRKGYDENNALYYDLLTYMEEKSDTTSPLLLRDSMRFNSLSEVVAGLEVDANCQALVTWGVTSATCNNANRHVVDFVKLETAEMSSIPAITAVMVGRCRMPLYKPPSSHNIQETQSSPMDIRPPFYEYYDTILQPSDITDCYSVSSQPPPNDTIEYTISCDDVSKDFTCSYWLSIRDIPADAEIEYYLNDTLVTDSNFYVTNRRLNKLFYLALERPHKGADSVSKVKIIIDGVEYNFKFLYNDNTTELADHLAQLPNIQLDADMHGGTLTLDSNTLTQSIQLPGSSDCPYDRHIFSLRTSFAIPPSIDSNNVLTFELKPDICSINLPIFLQCECGGTFNLTVKNSSCDEIVDACEDVSISVRPAYIDDPPSNDPGIFKSDLEYIIRSTTANNSGIDYVTVMPIITQQTPLVSIRYHTTCLNDTNYNVAFFFPRISANNINTRTVKVYYEMCVHLMNGTVCCDTLSFNVRVPGWIIIPIPGIPPIPGVISYKLLDEDLFNSPIVPPLYIKVFDSFGTQLIATLHSSVPASLIGSISYSHLPTGIYNIVFQWGDYIETIQVISTGSDR